MNQFCKNPISFFSALIACLMLVFSSGCASGGYKLTRQYSRWVNSQHIVLRIILYILTAVVYGVTLLIDAVIFNTIDFWEGRVSDGKFEFKDQDKTYFVHHERLPGSQLKQSTIKIHDSSGQQIQEVVLTENMAGDIEMKVDGKLRTKVREVSAIPVVSHFDKEGHMLYLRTDFSFIGPWGRFKRSLHRKQARQGP
jgi:hypothetical protein